MIIVVQITHTLYVLYIFKPILLKHVPNNYRENWEEITNFKVQSFIYVLNVLISIHNVTYMLHICYIYVTPYNIRNYAFERIGKCKINKIKLFP